MKHRMHAIKEFLKELNLKYSPHKDACYSPMTDDHHFICLDNLFFEKICALYVALLANLIENILNFLDEVKLKLNGMREKENGSEYWQDGRILLCASVWTFGFKAINIYKFLVPHFHNNVIISY